jgi:hypothetical protein
MRTMVLVALALTGVAFSAWKESPDAGTAAGAYSSYGAPIELGKGKAQAYVVRNQKTGHPVEVGVALTEGALEGLPQAGAHGGNGHEHYASYILALPDDHGTPYRFYRVSLEEHDAIDPARADYTPDSYRVSFDRAAGEYRVALTGLTWRE